MKVTAKITKSFTDAGKLKAFATVCLADAFLVTGVRVVACEKGITVFMPSMKDKEDEYRDVCFPIKPELRSQINTAVLNAYDACLKENEPDGEYQADNLHHKGGESDWRLYWCFLSWQS